MVVLHLVNKAEVFYSLQAVNTLLYRVGIVVVKENFGFNNLWGEFLQEVCPALNCLMAIIDRTAGRFSLILEIERWWDRDREKTDKTLFKTYILYIITQQYCVNNFLLLLLLLLLCEYKVRKTTTNAHWRNACKTKQLLLYGKKSILKGGNSVYLTMKKLCFISDNQQKYSLSSFFWHNFRQNRSIYGLEDKNNFAFCILSSKLWKFKMARSL